MRWDRLLTQTQVNRCLQYLGVTPGDAHHVQRAPSYDEGKNRLVALQVRVKRAYKKAALELHPDRQVEPNPESEELFRLLAEFHAWFAQLQLKPQRRPVVTPMAWSQWNASSTTTTVTTVNGHVVIIVA